jgi:hypothetical protein
MLPVLVWFQLQHLLASPVLPLGLWQRSMRGQQRLLLQQRLDRQHLQHTRWPVLPLGLRQRGMRGQQRLLLLGGLVRSDVQHPTCADVLSLRSWNLCGDEHMQLLGWLVRIRL